MAKGLTFWGGLALQVGAMVVAVALSFGYQRSEVASVKASVERLDRNADARDEVFRELSGKVEALTAEVRILNQIMSEERRERIRKQ